MKTILTILGITKRERKSLKQLQAEANFKDQLIEFKQPVFWMSTEKVL